MLEVLQDALLDSLKILPLLFLIYLLIEFLEHRRQEAFLKAVTKSKRAGPVYGAVLGCIPQCGFSGIMADFYSRKLITVGTLIAVFLSTSDEALPIFLSNATDIKVIVAVVGIKLVVGIIFGFIIDFIINLFNRKKKKPKLTKVATSHCDCGHNHEHLPKSGVVKECNDTFCATNSKKEDMCDCCSEGIFESAFKHTLKIFLYILIANIIMGLLIYSVSEETIKSFLLSGNTYQPFIASLIGLIPNCAASVLLVELYLAGSLSFASMIAGLCAGSGIGLLVLIKTNKNQKQNLAIVIILYLISVSVGFLISSFS